MKLFHLTTYRFFSRNYPAKKPLRIISFSDLHFSDQVKNEKLRALEKFISSYQPDYIFFAGDLVDSVDMIKKDSECKRLLTFLQNLGNIATLLIAPGNHDVYEKTDRAYKISTKNEWRIVDNSEFTNQIRMLKNVHYLNDESYEDNKIYVFGFNQKPESYNYFDHDKKVDLLNPVTENVEETLKELDDVDQKLISNLPKDKIKFIILHSPACLSDYRVKDELAEFDFTISGHEHNGLVPPVFDELIPSTRGIISATKKMFPKNIRNTIRKNGDKTIVTGAATTWHECTGVWHNLNAFYPSYLALLEFSNDDILESKPYVKKQYLNW